MKHLALGMLLTLGVGGSARAATQTEDVSALGAVEPVGSIWAIGGLHDFEPLDDDSLILWRTPFEPYPVELRFGSPDSRFAPAIAVASPTGRIGRKLDSIVVRGFRYPIEQIYELSREEARELRQDF